jgi:ATP-dependent DNA ligase
MGTGDSLALDWFDRTAPLPAFRIQSGMASPRKINSADIGSAAVPAEQLTQAFPKLNLPIHPPYAPAEAKSIDSLPHEPGWLYEPKWDGFRCLAFRHVDEVVLQSKAGQPLGRYFPEIVAALRALPERKFVLDGEIVIRSGAGLDFDALLQRIHPAATRIQRLSQETPSTYMVFDLLVDGKGRSLAAKPLSARRMELQEFAASNVEVESDRKSSRKADQRTLNSERILLSPASADFSMAEKWMREGAASGWDGVVAKRLDCEYMSGERTGMVKIKRIRTADCVVGGFRWARGAKASSGDAKQSKTSSKTADAKKRPTDEVGSLLLGLYNRNGKLDHIGFSSSFTREERKKLKPILRPLMGGEGFSGKAPGGPSRWTRDARDTEWFPLKPKLVGEFQYDHFSGGRFRHGTKFLRWRPDKKPEQCTMEQIRPSKKAA